jgi:drug/metabolite transporter (DMT)-like permease
MDRRTWALLVFLSAIWGGSFLLTQLAIRDLSVPVVSLARTGVGALLLLPIALQQGALRGLGRRIPTLLVLAVVQLAAPFLLLGYGQRHIDSGLAGILVASTPLWTALLAVRLDQEERSRGWALVGIATGIAGVVLLLGFRLGGSWPTLLGAALLLLGALGYAAGGFLAKGRIRGVAPVGVLCATMLIASAALLPFALASLPTATPRAGSVVAAIVLGAVSGGLGWLLYYTILARAGAARAAISMYLMPAFAVLYGAAFHGEPLGAATAAGLVLVTGGSWLASQRDRAPGRALPRRR